MEIYKLQTRKLKLNWNRFYFFKLAHKNRQVKYHVKINTCTPGNCTQINTHPVGNGHPFVSSVNQAIANSCAKNTNFMHHPKPYKRQTNQVVNKEFVKQGGKGGVWKNKKEWHNKAWLPRETCHKLPPVQNYRSYLICFVKPISMFEILFPSYVGYQIRNNQ